MTLDIFALVRPQSWMKNAACRQHPEPDAYTTEAEAIRAHADMWFDGGGYLTRHGESPATRAAIAICNGCDVRSECLQHALDNDEHAGVWGGLTPIQRRVIQGRAGVA